MIFVGDEAMPAEEEAIVRGELEGGSTLPESWPCDGCSGGCPDFWPPGRPRSQQIPLRAACVIHDHEVAYEGGIFPSFWHRATARWEADARLRRNWAKLPTIEPYATAYAWWRPSERWTYRALTLGGVRIVRLLGWLAR